MGINTDSPPTSSTSLRYGVTSCISDDGPTSDDLKLTKKLEECLRKFGLFESEQELAQRGEVIRMVNALVKAWVRAVSIEKGMPPDVAESVGGKVFTFGSYRLGVHVKGADIDTLCVVPRHIVREDFFTSFYDLLKSQPVITDLRAVEDAFVPVIKMKLGGIELDILFARLTLKQVPEQQRLTDDLLLKNLDQKCIRSLNGCRVADEILQLVPNQDTFRLALRAVKFWAKRQGVYSNVLGYLGGVSWTILVARICQLYPRAAASTLVIKFFLVFSQWEWPKPVLLKEMENNPALSHLKDEVWDPTVKMSDRYHLMPIITPGFPQQNSTFNVSISTRTILQMAFKEATAVTTDISCGKGAWDVLFDIPNFFGRYRHFVLLTCSTMAKEDHASWCGLVESKIRSLISSLERHEAVRLIHVNPEQFSPLALSEDKIETIWVFGLVLKKVDASMKSIDLTEDIQWFIDRVYNQAITSNIFRDGMSVEAHYSKRKQLSQYLPLSVINRWTSSTVQKLVTGHPECTSSATSSKLPFRRATKRQYSPGRSEDEPSSKIPATEDSIRYANDEKPI